MAASLQLLRLLEEHPDCSQGVLSRRMGVSLGKTHYLLRALLEKGWGEAQISRLRDELVQSGADGR